MSGEQRLGLFVQMGLNGTRAAAGLLRAPAVLRCALQLPGQGKGTQPSVRPFPLLQAFPVCYTHPRGNSYIVLEAVLYHGEFPALIPLPLLPLRTDFLTPPSFLEGSGHSSNLSGR